MSGPAKAAKHPLKRWGFPLLLMLCISGCVVVALNSALPAFDLENFSTRHRAESAVVIVPPPKTDLVRTPDVDLQEFSNNLNQELFRQKAKKNAARLLDKATEDPHSEREKLYNPTDLSSYQLHWEAHPEEFTLRAEVHGDDPKAAIALAETAAQMALEAYRQQLPTASNRLEPFLKKRMTETQKHLSLSQGKLKALASPKAVAPQTKTFLTQEVRHLENELDLLQAMLSAQKDINHDQRASWSQYARIKYHGRPVKNPHDNPVMPAVGLLSLCLLGVWLLKEEKLSPDEIFDTSSQAFPHRPRQSIVANLDNTSAGGPWEAPITKNSQHSQSEALQVLEETSALGFQSHTTTKSAAKRGAKPSHQDRSLPSRPSGYMVPSEVGYFAESSLLEAAIGLEQDAEPFTLEGITTDGMTTLRLQSPFLYGAKLLKLFNNPHIKKGFCDFLANLQAEKLPGIVGVLNSAELATAIALTLADSQELVTLIDLQLNTPELHKIFEIENDWGTRDLLSDPLGLGDPVQTPSTQHPLVVIPAGNPQSKLPLYFEHLGDLVTSFQKTPQHRVILNLPPLSDTSLFERCLTQSQCEGLLVCATRREDLQPYQTSFVKAQEKGTALVPWLRFVLWDILL